jgi:hypothetical protein
MVNYLNNHKLIMNYDQLFLQMAAFRIFIMQMNFQMAICKGYVYAIYIKHPVCNFTKMHLGFRFVYLWIACIYRKHIFNYCKNSKMYLEFQNVYLEFLKRHLESEGYKQLNIWQYIYWSDY